MKEVNPLSIILGKYFYKFLYFLFIVLFPAGVVKFYFLCIYICIISLFLYSFFGMLRLF